MATGLQTGCSSPSYKHATMASKSQTPCSKGLLSNNNKKPKQNSYVSFFTTWIWKTRYRHRTATLQASTSLGRGVSTEPSGEHKTRFAYAHTLPAHMLQSVGLQRVLGKRGVDTLKVRHKNFSTLSTILQFSAVWKLVTINYNHRLKCKNSDTFCFQLKQVSADFRGVLAKISKSVLP